MKLKPGDLVRIVYAGKPYRPGWTGWTKEDDQGYPGDEGKYGINLFDGPMVSEAGTFWTILISPDLRKKSIHESYLEIVK